MHFQHYHAQFEYTDMQVTTNAWHWSWASELSYWHDAMSELIVCHWSWEDADQPEIGVSVDRPMHRELSVRLEDLLSKWLRKCVSVQEISSWSSWSRHSLKRCVGSPCCAHAWLSSPRDFKSRFVYHFHGAKYIITSIQHSFASWHQCNVWLCHCSYVNWLPLHDVRSTHTYTQWKSTVYMSKKARPGYAFCG